MSILTCLSPTQIPFTCFRYIPLMPCPFKCLSECLLIIMFVWFYYLFSSGFHIITILNVVGLSFQIPFRIPSSHLKPYTIQTKFGVASKQGHHRWLFWLLLCNMYVFSSNGFRKGYENLDHNLLSQLIKAWAFLPLWPNHSLSLPTIDECKYIWKVGLSVAN